jgi:LPXTG-motif cell wall-anchored protein
MTADWEARRTRPAVVGVLLAFVVGVVALIGLAAPASAQYVPGQPGIIIDPSEMPDTGGTADIKGFGCEAASKVDGYIVVDGQEIFLGTTTAEDSEDGSFTIPVTIPPNVAGEYTILAKCGPLTLSTLLTLTPSPVPGVAPAGGTSGTLPVTGSDSIMLVRAAALLIAVGGLAALVVRKRRTSHAR